MSDEKITRYMTRLRLLGTDPVGRFFQMYDEELYDLELEITDSEYADAFYDELTTQFRRWREEMGEDAWRQVIEQNRSLNGANQNGLLDEI